MRNWARWQVCRPLPGLREGLLAYGLMRSLVQQIEGDIDVRSEAGVTMTISFPDLPSHEAAG